MTILANKSSEGTRGTPPPPLPPPSPAAASAIAANDADAARPPGPPSEVGGAWLAAAARFVAEGMRFRNSWKAASESVRPMPAWPRR
jgi:hypothetical protein